MPHQGDAPRFFVAADELVPYTHASAPAPAPLTLRVPLAEPNEHELDRVPRCPHQTIFIVAVGHLLPYLVRAGAVGAVLDVVPLTQPYSSFVRGDSPVPVESDGGVAWNVDFAHDAEGQGFADHGSARRGDERRRQFLRGHRASESLLVRGWGEPAVHARGIRRVPDVDERAGRDDAQVYIETLQRDIRPVPRPVLAGVRGAHVWAVERRAGVVGRRGGRGEGEGQIVRVGHLARRTGAQLEEGARGGVAPKRGKPRRVDTIF